MSREGEPVSAAISRSFGDPDEGSLCAVGLDSSFSAMLLLMRCSQSWSTTAFSRTLERNGKLEMGLSLARFSGSSVGFSSRGVMMAVLRAGGTWTGVKGLRLWS